MDYKHLTQQDELNLLRSRQAQLEVEFYEKHILLTEAEYVESSAEAKAIAAALSSIDARHNMLSEKIDALLNPAEELVEEAPDEENSLIED